jgi:hypothetical protein
MRLLTFPLRALAVSSFCLVIPLGLFFVELSLKAPPQSLRPRQDLHSMVSQKVLFPPLRSPEASLRFSPDGKYLLFQDPSGVMVISNDPLNIVLRVSIYSLHDGSLKARLVGVKPSASAQSNLRALDLGPGRFGIFDLNTGAKLDEQKFPEGIAYTHFSGDGNRLFVLTDDQTSFILDVTSESTANVASRAHLIFCAAPRNGSRSVRRSR